MPGWKPRRIVALRRTVTERSVARTRLGGHVTNVRYFCGAARRLELTLVFLPLGFFDPLAEGGHAYIPGGRRDGKRGLPSPAFRVEWKPQPRCLALPGRVGFEFSRDVLHDL